MLTAFSDCVHQGLKCKVLVVGNKVGAVAARNQVIERPALRKRLIPDEPELAIVLEFMLRAKK